MVSRPFFIIDPAYSQPFSLSEGLIVFSAQKWPRAPGYEKGWPTLSIDLLKPQWNIQQIYSQEWRLILDASLREEIQFRQIQLPSSGAC